MKLYKVMALLPAVTLFTQMAHASDFKTQLAESIYQSPRVIEAFEAYQSSLDSIEQAKAGYRPTLDMTLGYGYEWTGGIDEELDRREARLNLSQMLYDGGATSSEVDRQSARSMSALASLTDVVDDYLLEAGRAYLELLRHQQLLASSEETLENHKTLYDQIKRRAEMGVGSHAAVNQAQGRLSLAEVNHLVSQNNMLDAQATYERLYGEESPLELTPVPSQIAELPKTQAEAAELIDTRHPVMAIARADLEATIAQQNAAKAMYRPRVNFEVERRWDHNLDGTRGANEDLTAMVRLRWNLYNGGADQAWVSNTTNQIDQAEAIRQNALREAHQSLNLSWNALSILDRQITFLADHLMASRDTRDAYRKQFDIGQRTLLDLLDTENEVFTAQNQLTEAKIDHQIAQLRILNATGGLALALGLSLDDADSIAQRVESHRNADILGG